MCIKVRPDATVHPVVLGWKLVRNLTDKNCRSLVFKTEYRWNKHYRDREFVFGILHRPGIQAFVNQEDAIEARNYWRTLQLKSTHDVIPVLLYDARQGVIESMATCVDGRAAWIAPRIFIPKPVGVQRG